MTSAAPRPERNPLVHSSTLGEGYVVIEPTHRSAHALEGLAAAVWRWAEGGPEPEAAPGEVDALVRHLTQLGLLAPAAGQHRGRAPRPGVPPVGVTTIPLPLPCDAASPGFRFSTGRTTTGALDPDPGPHGV